MTADRFPRSAPGDRGDRSARPGGSPPPAAPRRGPAPDGAPGPQRPPFPAPEPPTRPTGFEPGRPPPGRRAASGGAAAGPSRDRPGPPAGDPHRPPATSRRPAADPPSSRRGGGERGSSRRGLGGDQPGAQTRRGSGASGNRDRATRPAGTRPSAGGRILRGLAGVLAGGLVVLALGLVVTEWLAGRNGVPGPGAGTLVAHVAGALAAVVGQVVADRRADRTGTLAALVVIGVAALVLGFGWFL
ncbi:hypothetical protein ACLFMI_02755 [Pseudonocardia nantongensis]|uniref:hypothetical protein n=1 Tax=Pseudonocardia nantongensis TaxID=1181885 RepID=UPI0039780C68